MSLSEEKKDCIDRRWYAMYTRSRCEKQVEMQLVEKGIESYLPMRRVLRRWSDRKKMVDEPLFRGYVFIHGDHRERYYALQTYGAVRIVSFNGEPGVVRDEEIQQIRRVLRDEPEAEACPLVQIGDFVEVQNGPFVGLQGRLEEVRNERRLVISIPSLQQGLRFNVDVADVRIL